MVTPFITASNISIRNGHVFLFDGDSWQMNKGEQWAVLGPNGSGKSTFVKALAGLLSLRQGRITFHFGDEGKHPFPVSQKKYIGYVSFDAQRRLLHHEDKKQEHNQHRKVKDFLQTKNGLMSEFNFEDLLEKSLLSLSTGELRKVLIMKSLFSSPKLLILDEPFDGLDQKSVKIMKQFIKEIITKGVHIIFVTHHAEEIMDSFTHVLLIKNGKIYKQGRKLEVLTQSALNDLFDLHGAIASPARSKRNFTPLRRELIYMKNVTVKYGNTIVLKNFNWTMHTGENWAIVGPNGTGKSTLLSLIVGDHTQAYSHNIRIFGKQKGTGESIWDIKKKIGYISTSLHVRHEDSISAYRVIVSGFFDSIGLYRKPNAEQKSIVDYWVGELKLQNIVNKDFLSLSTGQQRIILIVRSFIKKPQLLIADEPCHGLDIKNRARVLEIFERIASSGTNLIYVSHRLEEVIPAITHIMTIEKGAVTKNVKVR